MKNTNTGENNSGNWNSGYRNSGNWNSGSWNSGYWNSGDQNSGNQNSGSWNSGYRNSGFFNSDEPDKVRVFNKWVDMKPSEFLAKYSIYANLPLNRWVELKDMTDEEKKSVKGCKEMGGYLKTLPFKEACQVWWKENPNDHERFLSLPGFDAAIFKEITGIDVQQTSAEQEAIELLKKNGYKVSPNADFAPSSDDGMELEKMLLTDWQQFTGLHDKNGKKIYWLLLNGYWKSPKIIGNIYENSELLGTNSNVSGSEAAPN